MKRGGAAAEDEKGKQNEKKWFNGPSKPPEISSDFSAVVAT